MVRRGLQRVSFGLSCSYKGGLMVGVGLAMVSFLICFGYAEKPSSPKPPPPPQKKKKKNIYIYIYIYMYLYN